MSKRAELRRPLGLEVTADHECEHCGGTGLQLKQNYVATWSKIDIVISVCSCVRLVRKKQPNQYTKSEEESK